MSSWDVLGVSVLVLNIGDVNESQRNPTVSLALGMKLN